MSPSTKTRIDQITDLYDEICIEHPIRIDPTKILTEISLVSLSWILAICRKGYDSFKEVDLLDQSLESISKIIRKSISKKLEDSGKLAELLLDISDEPSLSTPNYYQANVFNWRLPPELVVSIINNNPRFMAYIFNNSFPMENKKDHANLKDHPKSVDEIIKKRLGMSAKENLKSTNPNNKKKVSSKTMPPKILMLKIICIMIEIDEPLGAITGNSVKDFIDEYIFKNHELQTLAELDDSHDDYFIVKKIKVSKENYQKRVSELKKDYFREPQSL